MFSSTLCRLPQPAGIRLEFASNIVSQIPAEVQTVKVHVETFKRSMRLLEHNALFPEEAFFDHNLAGALRASNVLEEGLAAIPDDVEFVSLKKETFGRLLFACQRAMNVLFDIEDYAKSIDPEFRNARD